jgi:hypothetical protein
MRHKFTKKSNRGYLSKQYHIKNASNTLPHETGSSVGKDSSKKKDPSARGGSPATKRDFRGVQQVWWDETLPITKRKCSSYYCANALFHSTTICYDNASLHRFIDSGVCFICGIDLCQFLSKFVMERSDMYVSKTI